MGKPKDRFDYQGEKLSQARSSLMAPHPSGEDQSFASAFDFCSRAFHQFDTDCVPDDSARDWISKIKSLMNTEGVQDTTGEGTFVHRARAMSVDEKMEFARAVDELASYFHREFWSHR
jgi:hypothetical protein